MASPVYSDKELVNGVVQHDKQIIERIYNDFRPRIIAFVCANSGSEEKAKEVFQDALIIIYRKAIDPRFELTSTFYTYLYGICRNLWRRELSKKSNQEVTIQEDTGYIKDNFNLAESITEHEKYRLFRDKLDGLKEHCRKLLELYFEKTKMEEIARLLGYSGENSAKKQKHECQKQLIANVKSDSRYKELLNTGPNGTTNNI